MLKLEKVGKISQKSDDTLFELRFWIKNLRQSNGCRKVITTKLSSNYYELLCVLHLIP